MAGCSVARETRTLQSTFSRLTRITWLRDGVFAVVVDSCCYLVPREAKGKVQDKREDGTAILNSEMSG